MERYNHLSLRKFITIGRLGEENPSIFSEYDSNVS